MQLKEKRKQAKREGRDTIEEDDPEKVCVSGEWEEGERREASCMCYIPTSCDHIILHTPTPSHLYTFTPSHSTPKHCVVRQRSYLLILRLRRNIWRTETRVRGERRGGVGGEWEGEGEAVLIKDEEQEGNNNFSLFTT